jgi:hypothetical protein
MTQSRHGRISLQGRSREGYATKSEASRGEITRFERLEDAVHSVMVTPSAKLFSIAWITTRDRHIDMEEIRQIERRSILSRHLG